MESKPEDIPKEELLQLCMKLNKKCQTLETKGKEIFKKKNSLQLERQKLLGLLEAVVRSTLQPTPPDADLDFSVVETAWNEWDKARRDQVFDLEQRLQAAEAARLVPRAGSSETNDETNANGNVTSTDNNNEVNNTPNTSAEQELRVLQSRFAKAEAEIDRLQNVELYLKEQVKILENVIIDKMRETENIQHDLDAMRLSGEEKVIFFQLQLNQSKTREETFKAELEKLQQRVNTLSNQVEEKDTILTSNIEMIMALQARLIETEPEIVQLRDKIKDHERRYSALQMLKVEQDNIMTSLQRDVKNLTSEKDSLSHRVKELEELKTKTDSQHTRIVTLNEQINTLKEEIEEKSAVITRLRSEAQTSERNHAMRTAMLATCESQLEELNVQLQQKEATSKDALERVSSLQVTLFTLESRLEERAHESSQLIANLETTLAAQKVDYENKLQSQKVEFQEILDTTKRDFGKKSAMARQILSEREEEVRILSSKVKELQEEIASGAPTERKIFELAQVQSRRDALHGVHKDTREVAFQQLQVKLASKDLELAQTQQHLTELGHEVLELRKVKQREGINMDYLKNIILQYMTFPMQSSEKLALVPVIAMLLQFTPKEMNDVQRSIRDPLFGTRPVKEVKKIDFSTATRNASSRKSSSSSATATTRQLKSPFVEKKEHSTSDQDLKQKLSMISGDILDLSTMSNEDNFDDEHHGQRSLSTDDNPLSPIGKTSSPIHK